MTEVVLIHCNIVNNDYQKDSRVWYTLVPNKSFGQLLDISPKNLIFLKIFQNCSEGVFVINKVKNTEHMLFVILKTKKLLERFTKINCKKQIKKNLELKK